MQQVSATSADKNGGEIQEDRKRVADYIFAMLGCLQRIAEQKRMIALVRLLGMAREEARLLR